MRSLLSVFSIRVARIASRILRVSETALLFEQHVLRHLLGDGGGADRAAAMAHHHQVGDGGAQDRGRIDAAMGPERLVLGGDEGLLHLVRDRRVGHEDAPLGGELADQRAVRGIDAAHHRRLVGAQPVDRRQVGGDALVGVPGEDAAADDRQQEDAEHRGEQAARRLHQPVRPPRPGFGASGTAAARAVARAAAGANGADAGPAGRPR